ncbi:MAG: hypothetical protein QOG59_3240, partial [Solirubrobacteraceae bacterium]|nr:hypothetical protein [Solirubrobacteraceae bacterium]
VPVGRKAAPARHNVTHFRLSAPVGEIGTLGAA